MPDAAKRGEGRPVRELLSGMTGTAPDPALVVSGLSMDSRKTRAGDLFLACRGGHTRGARHIPEAVRAGAAAVAVEAADCPREDAGRPLFPIAGLRARAGIVADRFYASPSRELRAVGVTGTNGKTTVAHLIGGGLARLRGNDRCCGLIGSLGNGFPRALRPGPHTTPDPVALHALLREMRGLGADYAAIEVSSHALDQERASGVRFQLAVFTNLGRDHLDYHGNRERYAAAKRRLLSWPGLQAAILNLDDAHGRRWFRELQDARREAIGYTLRQAPPPGGGPCLQGRIEAADRDGMTLSLRGPWGEGRLRTPLIGEASAGNLLAAAAALCRLGAPPAQALAALGALEAVPGRMERFAAPGRPLAVVDYAHNPEALRQALRSLRDITPGRLWCVFGCGGDRDRGKRPEMGKAAAELADRAIATNDNPRGEPPLQIIEEIRAGARRDRRPEAIPDRKQAIAAAIAGAGETDTVLVAGKGHERFQEAGGRRRPFDDRLQVRRALGLAP